MITGKDCRLEQKKAEETANNPKSTVIDILRAVVKLITVAIKILLNNRLNLARIMEHLQIDKIKAEEKKPDDNQR